LRASARQLRTDAAFVRRLPRQPCPISGIRKSMLPIWLRSDEELARVSPGFKSGIGQLVKAKRK
jgi:hypothetical protein